MATCDVELRALRVYLLESGISVSALAKKLGIGRQHLSVELSRGPRGAMHRRIEWCLQIPFWSNPELFHARSHIFLHTGHEPGQMTVRNLLKLCRETGLPTKYRPRDELILMLHEHLHKLHRATKEANAVDQSKAGRTEVDHTTAADRSPRSPRQGDGCRAARKSNQERTKSKRA